MIISRAALKWTIIAVFFCIFFGELSAQQVTIKGSVKDGADNSPLAGCTYGVPAEGVGGITDDEGKFMLKVSRKAEVSMIFRSMGYADSMIVIKIVPGKNLYVVDMVMGDNGEGGVVFKDVVFTAGRHAQDLAKVTGSMELVSSEKVDLQATNDVEDVLATTPGVDIIDGQPNIRGSSGYAYGVGSRVLLMLNGLPLLSPAAGSAQFDLVPVDNINQIEIMKGASSVLYGSSALGGVINVLTSDAPDTAKTSIRLVGAMYGSPKDPRLDWDGNKGARDASLNIFHSRKIKNADLTLLGGFWKETGFREGAGSKQGRLMVMTKFRPKSIPGLNWGVNASYRFDSASTFLFWDSYLPGDSVITFAGDTVFNSKGAYSGANSRRRQFNDRVTLDPFVKYLTAKNNLHYWRGRVMGVRNTNDTQQSNSSQLIYSDYQFTTRLWKDKATGNARLTWVTGLTGRMTFANGDSLYGDTRVDTLSCDSIGNCKTDTALIGGHYLAANGAIYSQMDAELTARLTASVGLRYDYWYIQGGEQYGNKIEQAPIFRAGLNYNAFTGNNIRASIGQAFRSPSVAERFTSTSAGGLIIEPNPDIKVEKGYSAEIGMRQGFRTGNKKRYILGYLDVAGFLMDYNNMIEFGLLPGDGVITNIKARFSARNVAD
ncbi:MAG TPA: hypothetical protein ENJ82_17235, partial [Bacteroidetes bacterium]|nr:hypothetical protein [Bacteroidota bacterium]